MEIALWIMQISLFFIYSGFGLYRTLRTDQFREKNNWAKKRTSRFLKTVGAVEVLGALGIILPQATGILSGLTPLAALGLTLIQIFAITTVHIPEKEYRVLPFNLYIAAMSVFVLFGRWDLIAG